MTLFVDTSGILALIDRDDPAHTGIVEAFGLGRSEPLATHAYVVVETLAVARRRFGQAVAADIIDRVLPAIEVSPVDAELHATAMAAFRDMVESSVSLVDRTSFAFMRRERIERAIAVDTDFRTARLETRP
ncbi:MAG TPA: PIN domain-containing protein [Candidatus Limnocylindrales bacterium]|nr:PIN domain-containing protein [Candidatus Limnocylindrales bacterium]